MWPISAEATFIQKQGSGCTRIACNAGPLGSESEAFPRFTGLKGTAHNEDFLRASRLRRTAGSIAVGFCCLSRDTPFHGVAATPPLDPH